jgi:aminomethyltransferase
MKQTAIHTNHLQRNAKMGEFRGWNVPVLFTGINEEYHAVRHAAGLFDIGFLGRIEVAGPGSAAFLQQVFSRDVSRQAEGSALYGLLCTDAGTILADAILLRLSSGGQAAGDRYLLTVSAGTTEKVLSRLGKHAGKNVTLTDRTENTAHFALQGPFSGTIIEKLSAPHFKKLRTRQVKELPAEGGVAVVSRTGYTGEDGYELILPVSIAPSYWDLLLQTGKDAGVLPCGNDVRDILRLEMGYLLYGNDIDETRTPWEAGLSALVDIRKDFIGRDALVKLKTAGTRESIVGFALSERALPRLGGSIFSENHEIGAVTSCALSPAMRGGIGLGYIQNRYAQPGQEVDIEAKDREFAAKVVEVPFYRKK